MPRRIVRLLVVMTAVTVLPVAGASHALGGNPHRQARCWACWSTWHGDYYDTGWGTPVALVVPPTASMETSWGWGVSNSRVSRINHQFARPYPGPFPGASGFAAAPAWPSDTRQMGVYYVRGPW